MRTINSENKTILLNQILKSESYSKLSDSKNNFKRISNYLEENKTFKDIYSTLIIPYLNNTLSLSDFNREALCKFHSNIFYFYTWFPFTPYEFKDYEYILNPELKTPYLIRNIKQENRTIKNLKRFLVLLRKEVQREINKKS